jgi:carboxyl-terminal processing protease
MSRWNLYWLLGITALTIFGLAVSQPGLASRNRDKDYENAKLLLDVAQLVRKKYAIELTPERERQLFEDMINGGLERLDPHSMYINAKDYKQFRKSSEGKFGGIGVQIGYDRQNRGFLTVISPIVGTPAYDAGIQAGDRILKIDGKSAETMRLSEAVDLIQGEPGEKLTITVAREGGNDAIEVPLTRAEIRVQSVLGDQRVKGDPKAWDFMIDPRDKIGYLRLTSFSETATTEMKAALDELIRQGVRGLVIDLRNNPGGLLRAAVEISDLFLDKGVIVTTKGRDHKEEVYNAHAAGTLLLPASAHPIAILINRNSASASEILAAALQDHGRAIVIGERSYGKGSVQTLTMLENETSALKLTTASYWRPSGKNIHRFPDSTDKDEWGVKPDADYEVLLTEKERAEYQMWRSDRDIVRAGKEPKPEDKNKPYTDKVMARALEYIRSKLVDPE